MLATLFYQFFEHEITRQSMRELLKKSFRLQNKKGAMRLLFFAYRKCDLNLISKLTALTDFSFQV